MVTASEQGAVPVGRSAERAEAPPLHHATGFIAFPEPVYFETFAPVAATGRPTVIMVHGGAHTGACYQRTADGRRGWAYCFVARGYSVVIPDWPGVGRSGYVAHAELSGETVVRGLGALIAAIGPPVVLLTHSMSGCYGWRLLELYGTGPARQHSAAAAGLPRNRERNRDRAAWPARCLRQGPPCRCHARFHRA
jgi:pimeloyl-ACP methyl ester carboxylesterase